MRFFKHALTIILISMFICLPCYAAETQYDVMGYDGNITQISGENIDTLIENIRKIDGDAAAEAYIAAMASGCYADFYQIVGNTTETSSREDYMTEDIQSATSAQMIESTIQSIYGPNGTAVKTGQAAVDAGFEATEAGLFQYWLAILTNKATRPEDATEPTRRISEIRAVARSQKDIEYNNQGIIVDYDDAPLTEEGRQLAEQFGYQVVKATDVYSEEELEADQGVAEQQNALIEANNANVQAKPVVSDVAIINPGQFILIAGIVIIAAVLITSLIMIIIHKRK